MKPSDLDSQDNLIIKSRKKPVSFKRKLFWSGGMVIAFWSLYLTLAWRGYFPPINYLADVLFASSSDSPWHSQLPQTNALNYNRPIAEIINLPNIDKNKVSILIEKSQFRLTVYYNRQPTKSYPVVLGFNPVGDKLKEGDGKTPEGILQVKDFYPHHSWSKFLWLDYPNKSSWIKNSRAKVAGKVGWWETIGGEVGIHGVPAGQDSLIDQKSNWTWGCISLKNQDVDEIYQLVQKSTIVEIIR